MVVCVLRSFYCSRGWKDFKTVKLNVYAKNFKVTTKLIELLSTIKKIKEKVE